MATIGLMAGCGGKTTEPTQEIITGSLEYNGYTYKTVKIGNQWWLAENLRTTKYNDGTNIPNVTNDNQWWNLESGAYCVYDNNNKYVKYGYLYNFYVVATGKLAPEGWRVPTEKDFEELINYCGGGTNAANKLKSKTNWIAEIGNGNDTYGFCAYAGGLRSGGISAGFSYIKRFGYWWTSSLASLLAYDIPYYFIIGSSGHLDFSIDFDENSGLSIRLIKE